MLKLHQRLAQIVGMENLLTQPGDIINYAQPATFTSGNMELKLPLAAARPANSEQMRDLLLFCASEGIPVCMRGGGTAPVNRLPNSSNEGRLVILTRGLNRILDINKQDRLAKVQCGVLCEELARNAREAGLFYPPDQGSLQVSTIGGALATNAAGPSSLKYGPTGNYVLELEILTSNGEKLTVATQNGQARKLAPGFPLAQLFCGSRGCLGLILNATISLLPKPETKQLLVISFSSARDAAVAAGGVMASRLSPFMMEYADENSSRYILDSHSANVSLLLGFDGTVGQVPEDIATAKELMSSYGASAIQMPEPAHEAEIMLRRGRLPVYAGGSRLNFLFETFVCPPSRLPALVEGIEQIAANNGLGLTLFGHAGIARLHAIIFYKDGNRAIARQAARDMFTLELVLNNAMEAEEDMTLGREAWQEKQKGLFAISSQLQHIFDPAGIFSGDMPSGRGPVHEK